MKHIALVVLCALVAAVTASTAQQIQIPVDADSRLERIGTDLELSCACFRSIRDSATRASICSRIPRTRSTSNTCATDWWNA
ncbi:MAG: hypothetical protein IPP94_17330 [Ignavibacteria bacterium]|nr:hypothetical protein [Ignavibacteria bacterium]